VAIDVRPGAQPDAILPTASLGFAWGAQGSDFDHLVGVADEAMYREKREHHIRRDAVLGRPSPEPTV
jgi:PleD family two-component response regulator